MRVEVLVSTVNNDARKLVKKMNIQTDAIIINQCDKNEYEEFKYKNHKIKVYSFNERGIGLSRNTALMRASGDIVVFADDDEVFVDCYDKLIINAFEENKKADFIVFDINTCGTSERKYKKIKKSKKLHCHNCLKYGAVRYAIKREIIIKKNVFFNLLFGGGAKYGSGEDSIFIFSSIKNNMNVFTSSIVIANVDMSNSSWFNGFNDKYYYDKGALMAALNSKMSFLYLIAITIKNHKNDLNNTLISKLKNGLSGFYNYKKKKGVLYE